MKKIATAAAVIGFCCGNAQADLKPDYVISSNQLGENLFVDYAQKGGGDSEIQNGYVWWVAEIRGIWEAGGKVTLTGIALPIHANSAAPSVISFKFYDLGSDNVYSPGDKLVGTAKETYPGGATGAWFANFAEPISFIAEGNGVAVGFVSEAGKIHLKVVVAETAPGVVRKKEKDGEPVKEKTTNFAMSLAGTAQYEAK